MKAKTLAVVAIATLALAGCGASPSEPEATPTPAPRETATMDAPSPKPANPVAYEVVEEKDFSYSNCRRVGYKIKVADGTSPESVDATQQQIIDENRSSWDDITVWTYNESDTDDYVKNLSLIHI